MGLVAPSRVVVDNRPIYHIHPRSWYHHLTERVGAEPSSVRLLGVLGFLEKKGQVEGEDETSG